jgi:nucleotide-binding universal stress UspA family protein
VIPRKILFCTDFSENSEAPRALAADYAKTFNASLAIAHVVQAWAGFPTYEFRVPVDLHELTLQIQESVSADLEEMAKQCTPGVPEVTTYCKIGSPAQEIVKLAKELNVDLIIMGTHGWTGFKHLLLGSVAENVLRLAACPVLVVKSAAAVASPQP